MAMDKRPRRKQTTGLALNNQTLLILVGILSAVLIVLLVICGSIVNRDANDPADNALNSGTPSSSTAASESGSEASSSVVTQPSSSVVPPTSSVPPTTVPKLPVTPSGENYINVGSGYIAEVIQANVETFTGTTADDYTHPTNNYLPEGTMDYCDKEFVYGSNTKYVKLRSGHRVYFEKKVYPPVRKEPEVKQYAGYLPDHNEIGVVSLETVGRHSILTLDCLWKAPFYFKTNQSG